MVGLLSFLVCLVISGGLGYGAYVRFRTDRRRATRLAALALLPVGLDLAGFVRLGRKGGGALGHWGLPLVFAPLVWIGIVMLGVAALLWTVAGAGNAPVDEPSAVANTPARAVGSGRQKVTPDEDPEIEAILRKHGVT